MEQPKLLSIPKAARVVGVDTETLRAWTKRAFDPLPTVPGGDGDRRVNRKVVMASVDAWLERNSTGRESA